MRTVVAALFVLATSVLAAPPVALDLRVTRRDGTVGTVRDLVGDRAAVVVFWATYCAPCRAEVPALNRALERWGTDGLRVIGVAIEPDDARIREAAVTWGIRYDVVAVEKGQEKVTDALFPKGLPASAIVSGGNATMHDRALDDATLEQIVPPMLGSAASAPPAQ